MQDELEQTPMERGPAPDAITALLSAIVDSSHDAIISKTLDGIITSWNRAAQEMFGYTAAEAIGQSIKLIIPKERLPEEDYVLSKVRSGEKVDHFETERQTKDGRRLSVSLTVSPIRDASGAIIGASKISRDITEKKRLERELEQLLAAEQAARQKLAEAVAARDDFIAVAAHELRNPLNVFLLNLQLLHRISTTPGYEQIRGLIEKTREQVGRITTLVDRLLDVTRVQTGTFELYRETFDLGALLREIAARSTTVHPSLSMSLQIEPNIAVQWDRIRIDQAITNLVSNAFRYGAKKPITLSAHVEGHEAVISVQDRGVGMSPEDLERIFDRFERAGRPSGSDGLGLGLWITKQIVQGHGGAIFAQSQLGEGSTFVLRLPLRA